MGTFSRIIPGRMNRRGMGLANAVVAAPFNGNFASLFPGAFQVVQSDLGLTYGGTPLAAGTTPVVGTITGTLATTPVPILFTCTTPGVIGAGAIFAASFNGGVSNAMTGINPAAGTPFPLTGAATGLSMTWAAGSALADNTWTATSVSLSDQSGNGFDYSQAVAGKQPIITVGVNGKPGLLSDGVDDFFASLLNLPTPAATPFTQILIGKVVSWTLNRLLCGGTGGNNPSLNLSAVTPSIQQIGAAVANVSTGMTVGSFAVLTAAYGNSTSDYLRAGSAAAVTGANAGSVATPGRQLFARAGAGFSNFELLACLYVPGAAINEAPLRAAVTSFYGGSVLV